MEYVKPWLSYEQQADRLEDRGLVFDRAELIEKLEDVGYYRLSGYWHIFITTGADGAEKFIEGTTLDHIWRLYVFDRQLRLLTLDAIERFEVYMRTSLAYRLAKDRGAFGYGRRAALPNMTQDQYGKFITRCFAVYGRSKEPFVNHFKEKYGDVHGLPPYWILVNIMDFGLMTTLYRGAPNNVRDDIAKSLNLNAEVLSSWTLTLNTIRNLCAHHDRLWNKRLGNKVKLPRKHQQREWHEPFEVNNSTTFTLLTILGYLIERIMPSSSWFRKTILLIQSLDEAGLKRMGFRQGWQSCPIWNKWLHEHV